MAKGRPRKPTALLKLSGSLDKHKERLAARSGEPTPDPNFGNVPRHITDNQKLIWRELMSEIPAMVASKADRKVVELTVLMIERMRNNTARSSDFSTLMRCLAELGMTPASRSKVSLLPSGPTTTNADPYGEFLDGDEDQPVQ